jgi:hypothetical protein
MGEDGPMHALDRGRGLPAPVPAPARCHVLICYRIVVGQQRWSGGPVT